VSKAAKRERQRQNRMARKEYEEAIQKRRRFWRSARTFGLLLIPIVLLFAFLALRNGGDDDKSSSSNDKTSFDDAPGEADVRDGSAADDRSGEDVRRQRRQPTRGRSRSRSTPRPRRRR
jgi:hypothetical protein